MLANYRFERTNFRAVLMSIFTFNTVKIDAIDILYIMMLNHSNPETHCIKFVPSQMFTQTCLSFPATLEPQTALFTYLHRKFQKQCSYTLVERSDILAYQ
jgi:hypothetical protein